MRQARPEVGRFRSFLLASLKHFMANEWDRSRALKRGGDRQLVSFDVDDAERRFRLEPVDSVTPEQVFEKRWAMAVVHQALDRLHGEHQRAGTSSQFEHLRAFLTGDEVTVPYRQMAAELGLSEGAVKVKVHRLRKRFGELLRAEIADTVAGPEEVEAELRHLIESLGT